MAPEEPQIADYVAVGAQALADAYGYSTVQPFLLDYARTVAEGLLAAGWELIPPAALKRALEDGGRIGKCDYCDADETYVLPSGSDLWMCDQCVLECLPTHRSVPIPKHRKWLGAEAELAAKRRRDDAADA